LEFRAQGKRNRKFRDGPCTGAFGKRAAAERGSARAYERFAACATEIVGGNTSARTGCNGNGEDSARANRARANTGRDAAGSGSAGSPRSGA
jgi:hypothetical protein